MASDSRPGLDALRAQLEQLSPERRALVERHLRSRAASATTIPRRSDDGPAPLTFNQELLWALDQAVPDLVAYNVPRIVRVRGALDVDALERALSALVARHEALRTRFVAAEHGPRQVVGAPERVVIDRRDLRGSAAAERDALANLLVRDASRHRFNLARDLLLRATVLQLADDEWIVVLLTHHIVCDEWSRDVTFRDLGALYAAECGVTGAALPPLPLQYADFAAWQRDAVERGTLAPHVAYWREELAGAPALDLPTDRPRGAAPSFAGSRRRYVFDRGLAESLRTLGQSHDATMHMVLLAAYTVVLARHSGQNDIVVGSPITGRRHVELEDLVGYFPNTIVLRSRMADDPPVGELVRRVRETCLRAYEHQDVPLDLLALEMREQKELGSAPLFNVFFLTLAGEAPRVELAGVDAEVVQTDFATAKFDILVGVSDRADGLHVVVEYRDSLFDPETIDRFAEHYRRVLEGFVADTTMRVSDLPLLGDAEAELVLHEWNATTAEYPADATLISLVRAQALRTPGAVAVAVRDCTLSYAELMARADRVAAVLRARGAGRGTLVGVCLERDVDLVPALLGVLATGAGYVPLDPAYPPARLEFILRDSAAPIVLTQPSLAAQFEWLPTAGQHAAAEVPGTGMIVTGGTSTKAHVGDPVPEDVAYIIYTSGSTGIPKGVRIENRNAVALVAWALGVFGPDELAGVLASTSYCFDLSIFEMFVPLSCGGAAILVHNVFDLADPRAVQSIPVTLVNTVPSAMGELLRVGALPASVRTVNLAGEPLAQSLVDALYAIPSVRRVYDLYGPSETTTYSTFALRHPAGTPSIGVPIANTRTYVLDAKRRPVPIGVRGELFIAGVGVSPGYLGRPELTTERFSTDPFAPRALPPHERRMYRTGDLVRWRNDGTLEYAGRIDRQVKLRGFRIELDEIAAVLGMHPDIDEAAVTVHEAASDNPRLVGYVVPRQTPKDEDGSESIARWAELFDHAYTAETHAAGDGADGKEAAAFAGWVSSYDDRPIPIDEMREWVESTYQRIAALRPRRVLELGCGTGLLMFPLLADDRVEHYHGIDVSRAAVDIIRSDPRFEAVAARVTLGVGAADETADLVPGSFDTVVINSVAQYFPDVDYLVTVLERAVRLVAPGGSVFLGDVRLLPLLETMHASVAAHRAPADASVADLRARIHRQIAAESELIVHPDFAESLRLHLPQIWSTEVLLKSGTAVNELTKFRGDVVFRVGVTSGPAALAPVQASTIDDVRALLRADVAQLELVDLVDARVARDVHLHELIRSELADLSVSDVRHRLDAAATSGIDPAALVRVDSDWEVAVRWPRSGKTGRFDASLRRRGVRLGDTSAPAPVRVGMRPWREFVRQPAPPSMSPERVDRIATYLRERLPAYMVPTMLVPLRALPRTPNGKIDIQALQPPAHPTVAQSFIAPRTETEKRIAAMWADVLRISQVGVDDGFLDMGGHSLLAMRIIGRIRREFGMAIELEPLLRGATLAEIATLVDEALSDGRAAADDDEFDLAPISRDAFSLGAPRAGGHA